MYRSMPSGKLSWNGSLSANGGSRDAQVLLLPTTWNTPIDTECKNDKELHQKAEKLTYMTVQQMRHLMSPMIYRSKGIDMDSGQEQTAALKPHPVRRPNASSCLCI